MSAENSLESGRPSDVDLDDAMSKGGILFEETPEVDGDEWREVVTETSEAKAAQAERDRLSVVLSDQPE